MPERSAIRRPLRAIFRGPEEQIARVKELLGAIEISRERIREQELQQEGVPTRHVYRFGRSLEAGEASKLLELLVASCRARRGSFQDRATRACRWQFSLDN